MDERTAEALEGSIEKWRKIVAETGIDEGGDNCPLCDIFVRDEQSIDEMCQGCPVAAHAGIFGCFSTPFVTWSDHQAAIHGMKRFAGDRSGFAIVPGCKDCVRLAEAELAFLESLREPVSETEKQSFERI